MNNNLDILVFCVQCIHLLLNPHNDLITEKYYLELREESHISLLKLWIAYGGALILQAGLSVPEHIFWQSTYPKWTSALCPTAETLKITVFFIS